MQNAKCKINTKGFTLVELLVTIAVIASIMAILFPNFMGMRQRARDQQRKSDLNQIQKALELYKLDQTYAQYPDNSVLATCGTCWASNGECTGNIYMRKVPCDPSSPIGGTPTPYIYARDSDILKYTLITCLENPADPDADADRVENCTEDQSSITLHEP